MGGRPVRKEPGLYRQGQHLPRHVPGINAVFSPTQAEIAYAQEVLAAIDEAKEAGPRRHFPPRKMIDAPIVTRARQTLASAQILGLIGVKLMETKLLPSLSAAMKAAGLRDGMTISFHHHLRNGDYILNLVLEEAARMGVRDLTVNASSLFDIHMPIVGHIRNGVVTRLLTDYVSGGIGRHISQGVLSTPVEFRPTAPGPQTSPPAVPH